MDSRSTRILAFAYACEPEKGSEPGAGWVWAQLLAELGDVWVLTRANNRPAIEAVLPQLPARGRMHFVYVDLPSWARFWKRGQRGVRAYYLLWQFAALVRARRLRRRHQFDLVWHLTMANAWLGSTAPLAGSPFIYGPVGGGVGVAWRLLPGLGVRGAVYELIRAGTRLAARYLNPLARLAWLRARVILVQNPETAAWLPRRHRHKAVVFPHAVISSGAQLKARTRRPSQTALFAGRLLAWKGVAIAMGAIAAAPPWRLLVCGAGPEEARLRRLAAKLGLNDRVDFLGWQPREDVLRLMREESDVLLYPSLHDDSPLAVTDALSAGLPVVSLARGGPPVLGGDAAALTAIGSRTRVERELARRLGGDLPLQRVVADRARELSFDARAKDLEQLVGSMGIESRLGVRASESSR
jgi:glycosyltransferase involved in cell wall biosynthesis